MLLHFFTDILLFSPVFFQKFNLESPVSQFFCRYSPVTGHYLHHCIHRFVWINQKSLKSISGDKKPTQWGEKIFFWGRLLYLWANKTIPAINLNINCNFQGFIIYFSCFLIGWWSGEIFSFKALSIQKSKSCNTSVWCGWLSYHIPSL